MDESYSLNGIYRAGGQKVSLEGVITFNTKSLRLGGSLIDGSAPEQKRTINGKAEQEGMQNKLDFIVDVPGEKLFNIHYVFFGVKNSSSLSGNYNGQWEHCEKSSVAVSKPAEMKEQYATLTLALIKEKKRKRK